MTIKIEPEIERLAHEIAEMTGESDTESVHRALLERRERLANRGLSERGQRFLRYLEQEVWPRIPPELRGKGLTRQEREEILGIGPEGA